MHYNLILESSKHEHYLDEGDSEVVRGGVEPLDGRDHAGVVHQAQELSLDREVVTKSNI